MADELITTTVDGNFLLPHRQYILVLGGGSKLAIYIADSSKKYSNTKIECIHLRTKHCLKHGTKKYSNHFKRKKINIIGICPLSDSLIPFADAMNVLWNLPHNDTKTSEWRRNKALMHQHIAQFNEKDLTKMKLKQYVQNFINKSKRIPDVQVTEIKENNQVRFGKFFEIKNHLKSQKEFEDKMKTNDLQYPVVIKPPTSGGTDGVRLCHTFEAAQKVVHKHLFKENSEKNTNVSMMCQEFLNGDEYVVNTVSFDSNHKISDVWRAHKTFIIDKTISMPYIDDDDAKHNKDDDNLHPVSMLYDYQQLIIDLKTDRMECVTNYVCSVLDILGVKYGCGHSEVIYLPKENKVCLVELNARCGGGIPRAQQLVGYDQYALIALSYMNSDRFVEEIPLMYKCIDKETVRVLFCQSQIDGSIDLIQLNELQNLKTFDKFAREFVYVGIEIWMKYQVQLLLMQLKLNHLKTVEQQTFAQMDNINYHNLNITDATIARLEQETEECNHRIRSIKRTIVRIEKIEKTVDLISSPGAIVLKGKLCDIEKDYDTIRELEKDTKCGIFIDGNHPMQQLQNAKHIAIDSKYNEMMTMFELIQQGFTLNDANIAVELSLNE